jgi:hypothetical protein
MIEALEPRKMLAVFTGTTGNDTINIFASGSTTHVVVNGVDDSTTDLNITIGGGLGDDHFTVQSTRTGSSILVLGQNGNDFLENPSVLDLDAVFRGVFTFDGGSHTDTLAADNRLGSTTAMTVDLQLEAIVKNRAFAWMGYLNTEVVLFGDSNGSNRICFTSSQAAGEPVVTHLDIRGNGGNDVITNTHSLSPSTGDWFTSMPSVSAFVDGGSGTDTLLLKNNSALGETVTINSTSIDVDSMFKGAGPLTYATCESIDFLGNNGGESVIINSKPSGTVLHFDASAGNDTFTVGGGDFDNGFLLSNTTLLGGTGADAIVYQDGGDTAGNIYSWGASSLARGTLGFNVSSIETRTLHSANALVFNGVPNTIDLNTCASDVLGTTIVGGWPSVVNVMQAGTLDNLFGSLAVNLGGGASSQLIINDQNSGGPVNGYQVSGTFVSKNNTNQTISYSGVGQLTLNTSGVFDVVNATGTGAGTALNLNTNGGDDMINVGGGNLDADFGGNVTVNGGSGANTATLSNAGDTTLETQTLNGATFTDGFSHTFNSLDTLTIICGSGGTSMAINATAHKTFVGGGSGPDTFTVGGGDIDANLLPTEALALDIGGGGGTDSIILNDINDTVQSADFYRFSVLPSLEEQFQRIDNNQHYVRWSNMEGIVLEASSTNPPGDSSAIEVNDAITPLRINGNAGNDNVFVRKADALVTVHTGLGGADTLIVGDHEGISSDSATVIVELSDDVDVLAIRSGFTLRVNAAAVLYKNIGASDHLSIDGILDLHGGFLSRNPMPVSPVSTFRAMLINGRNGGAWNGTGPLGVINSSLAASTPVSDGVGFGLGSQANPTTIGPFNIAPGDTLLRYTLDGDADLDTDVDLDDVGRWSINFTGELGGVGASKVWVEGDWDYDGDADLDDVGKWSVNFTGELGGGLGSPVTSSLSTRLADRNSLANRPFARLRYPFASDRIITSVVV